ncbi:DUF2911 domain-containing protein [Salegentibacter chungangensis]|uniref:DUF2911 domain-containing protein n=1 Tax=Salegentibacter chungangensis TaxID=1335724 RepID=A0ABW3NQH7_9FLAO
MNRILKRSLKVIALVIVIVAGTLFVLKKATKSYSPEKTITYSDKGLELEVFYNRPYKKDREIFGELVPYNKVWRTGANEASTFKTNKDILIDGSLLKSGKYSLWTIPGKESWKVIFNSKMYPWGINIDEEAYRNEKFDELVIETAVHKTETIVEQFTVSFNKKNELLFMNLSWDRTLIEIPIKRKEAGSAASSLSRSE